VAAKREGARGGGGAEQSVFRAERLSPQQEGVDRPVVEGVLLVMDEKETVVGKPFVDGAEVKLKIIGPVKGKKIRAATYKAKSRERKVRGFRAQYTEVVVEDIIFGEKKAAVKKSVKSKS
jgi:large subunit ribosomal protein L21